MTGEDESPYDEGLRGIIEQAEIQEASRRRFFYADVEALVTVGFLTHTVDFDGTPITFRSLPTEVWSRFMARQHKETSGLAWFLVESIYMMDGLVVADDPNAAYVLYREWASRLPNTLLMPLISIPNGLNRRVDRASLMAEAFSHEPFSRSFKHRSLSCADNIVRTLWMAHVEANETFDKDFIQWSHTITIVAAMAGSKGANQVSEGLEKVRKKEKARRNEVIERAINDVIGNRAQVPTVTIEFDGKVFEVPHVLHPSTVDDLFREMDQVMKGRKDYHDEIVARYKQDIRDRMESTRREYQALAEQASRLVAEEQGSDRPALVGYTPEQLAEYRPDATEPRRATITDQSGANRLYDRYLSADQRAGWLNASGDPEEASTRPTPPEEGASDEPSLQARIEGRRPAFRTDPDESGS